MHHIRKPLSDNESGGHDGPQPGSSPGVPEFSGLSPDTEKLVDRLAERMRQIDPTNKRCPGCDKRLGKPRCLCFFHQPHKITLYALCRACTARLQRLKTAGRQTFATRIEYRLERTAFTYAAVDASPGEAEVETCGIPARAWRLGLHIGRPDSPWSADDRAWFAAHPDRAHRWRKPFPDEIPTDLLWASPYPVIVVRQVAPGKRARPIAFLPHDLSQEDLDEMDWEEGLHALFDALVDRAPNACIDPALFSELAQKGDALMQAKEKPQ